MPIDYTSTTSGLFVRLGKIINVGKDWRSAQNTLVTHIEETLGKYTATAIDRTEYLGQMAGNREDIADTGRPGQSVVREAIERTIIEQVDEELSPGLEPSKTIDNALLRLTEDMTANTTGPQSIGTTGISFSGVTNASTTFDGTIIMSPNERFNFGGVKGNAATSNDNPLAETLTARCVKDARDGSLILGNERFEVAGDNAVDRLDRTWPQGSGCRVLMNATCSDMDSRSGPGQNMLTNSGFERLDGTPFPLDWSAGTGTIGTNLTSSSTAYRGSYALKFEGDGSAERSVFQIMGQGPRARIKTNTSYVISARIRAETADVTVGIFQFALTDASGNILSNCVAAHNAGSATVTTTDWTHVKNAFTTPLNLPADVRFRIQTGAGGSALAAGAKLIIEEVVLAEVVTLYPGGPGAVIIPGTANFELADSMKVSIAKTQAEWHLELDRYLDLAGKGVRFPTSNTPTISSGLIA
jgi:hypothetical protein